MSSYLTDTKGGMYHLARPGYTGQYTFKAMCDSSTVGPPPAAEFIGVPLCSKCVAIHYREEADKLDPAGAGQPGDWTVKDGRSNSSDDFNHLVKRVEALIRQSGYDLIAGRADRVAGLILAQLAHIYHMRPIQPLDQEEPPF